MSQQGFVNGVFEAGDISCSLVDLAFLTFNGIQMANCGMSFYLYPVDAKVAASTQINTTAIGVNFFPEIVRVIVLSASTVTIPPVISIGTNSASYNNILPATTLTGLAAADSFQNFSVSTVIPKVPSGTGIFLKVSTPATATTLSIGVYIRGVYTT